MADKSNGQSRYTLTNKSYPIIVVLSEVLPLRWATRMLQHHGYHVRTEVTGEHADIVIRQPMSESAQQSKMTIILKDLDILPVHLLALSGHLSTFGQKYVPFYPHYLVEAVLANSITIIVLESLLALKRVPDQPNSVKELSGLDCIKYFGAFNISAKHMGFINNPRGGNLLDGGAPFYSIYQCKEGSLAVGILEPKFYYEMVKGLPLSQAEKEYLASNQMNREYYPKMRKMLGQIFATKTDNDWYNHFSHYDTCIAKVKPYFYACDVAPKLIPMPKL